MKKFFALLVTMAMVMSLFSGVVLAADPTITAVGFVSGESIVKNTASKVQFTVTPGDEPVEKVEVDFGYTGFVPAATAQQTLNDGWSAVTDGKKVTFTKDPGVIEATTFKVAVTNPDASTNVTSGITFKVNDNAVTPADYSLKTGSVTVSPTSAVAGQATTIDVTAYFGGVTASNVLTYKVLNGASETVSQGNAASGSFSITVFLTINGTDANKTAETYTVEVYDGTTKIGSATVEAKYSLQLDSVGDVYRGDIKTFSGKLLNSKNEGVSGKTVKLKNMVTGQDVASGVTATDGSFVFAYQFATAGLYKIFVGDDAYTSIAVKPQDSLTLSIDSVLAPKITLDSTASLAVEVKKGSEVKTSGVEVVFKDPNGNEVYTASTPTDGKYVYTPGSNWVAGTYTITAKLTKHTYDSKDYWDYSSSTTYTVASPSKLNTSINVNGQVKDIYPNGAILLNVTATDKNGNGLSRSASQGHQITKVEWTATGPIAKSVSYDSATDKDNAADGAKVFSKSITLEQAGTLVVTGKVTFYDGTTETFEKSLTISGYVVNVEKTLGTVGDEVTLTATVTTADGTPVNNAKVRWIANSSNARFEKKNSDGTYASATNSVDVNWSTSANINNGVYSVTTKLTAAGAVNIIVADPSGHTRALFAGEIQGTPTYTVTTSKDALVATKTGQTVDVKVTNAEGKAVMALSSLKLESSSILGTAKTLSDATAVDTDSDGVLDSYRFTLTPKAAGNITITAATDGGNKIGKATLVVNKPNVTITPEDGVITDSVKETVTISYNDEVSAGAYLRVTPKGTVTTDGVKLYDVNSGSQFAAINVDTAYPFASQATSHSFKVLAKDVVETTEVAPEVVLEVSYDNTNWVEVARLAVKPIVIETDKEEVAIGTGTPVVVTVKDAHGQVITNKAVNVDGAAAAAGTTDNNGQTTLTVNPASTGNVNFKVTSNDTVFTKTIKAVADAQKPVITLDNLPAQVKSNTITVTGVVTDNVKVSSVYVNNNPVLVIPGAETGFDAEVTLKLGKNVIRIFAFDAAGNAEKVEVEVEYVLPTVVKLAIGSADATIDGQAAAGVAPYLKNNNTMVPFRFIAEALGAYVEWNAEAQTVTLSLDGTTVVLTIGSTTAFVNGEAKTMPVAPEITDGRTMVPLRFVGEALGADVDYNAATGGITVTR